MTTYSRRGLHGQVVNELGFRILHGVIRPGETLDPDALVKDFDVSRTVVREALKVLSAKGLVDARPRLGTYVTERSRWQLFDNDVMVWRSQDGSDPLLFLELGEVRQIIEPAAAKMAATRRNDDQLASIEAALIDLESTWDRENEDHVEADLRFHRAVLAASGNELLEQFEGVLEPALQARDLLASQNLHRGDFLGMHRAVFLAIQAQDPTSAKERMQHLMEEAAKDTELILGRDPEGQAAVNSRTKAL
jgi:GntR family galactonate operon transcriptional repressor